VLSTEAPMEARGQLARAARSTSASSGSSEQLRAPAKKEPAEAGFSFTLG
jgi:hypothetical protein